MYEPDYSHLRQMAIEAEARALTELREKYETGTIIPSDLTRLRRLEAKAAR